jgi:cbb3-type cytochrome oxidase subunit 3
MRMTEIVSFLDLSIFPSVALVFFLIAFIAIVWTTLTTSKAQTQAQASIPLDDDTVFTPRTGIQTNIHTDTQTDTQTDRGTTHG